LPYDKVMSQNKSLKKVFKPPQWVKKKKKKPESFTEERTEDRNEKK